METAIEHPELIPANWPTMTIGAMSLFALVLWVGTHLFLRRWITSRWAAVPMFLVRCGMASTTLWLFSNLLSRLVLLATSWSIVGIAVFCGTALELVLAFYRFEQKFVTRRVGTVLAGLRIAMILVLGAILLQPVLAWSTQHTRDRFIAILVDDSASMGIIDQQLTDTERLGLIRVFDPSIAKPPYDLANVVTELAPLADQLSGLADVLVKIAADQNVENALTLHRQALTVAAQEAQRIAGNQVSRVRDLLQTEVQLKAETRQLAESLQSRLDSDVVARMLESEQRMKQEFQDQKELASSLVAHYQGAAATVRDVISQLPGLIDAADRSYIASLPPEKLEQSRQVLNRTRADIARVLLAGDEGQIEGLLGKIREGYQVRLFRFHRECHEEDVDRWGQSAAPTAETAVGKLQNVSVTLGNSEANQEIATKADRGHLQSVTNITAALKYVQDQIPSENLAGVLLVTDGRHNGADELDAVARQWRAREIPVSALVIGSSRPPVDAAILDVEWPATVLVDDLLVAKVRIHVTGLQGRSIEARLYEGAETVQQRTIQVPSDDYLSSIELSHTPKQEGFRNYRVVISPVEGDQIEKEAFAENNERSLTVAVSDNRTEVMIVEGRPRWEYGYIRNLFAGRDSTVQLQTVLLEPDRLDPTITLPVVHASASREAQQIEATALPASEEEWMKFDVIILGDVPPAAFTAAQHDMLQKFVSVRGGALIVIAGARHMPHQFTSTRLAEMLPIVVEPSDAVQFASPEEAFDFRLTQTGERHEILRQADDVPASLDVWRQIPKFYWRHTLTEVKPGAIVLAYAGVEQHENKFAESEKSAPTDPDAQRARREAFEKQHALLAIQKYGLGRVLMLTTDRTWRLRYRVGDEYHHRFWGQIIRWATAEKLQAGTQFVQIGTDRVSYDTDEPVTVTAKLTDSYFAPINDPRAVIKVFRGEELMITKSLEADGVSPGGYKADLGKMPDAGAYRIELDSPEAERVFAGREDGQVETRFTVLQPEEQSPELIELTADRASLARFTSLAGGTVVEADSRNHVFNFFGEGNQSYTEEHSQPLWDAWPLLFGLVVLLTAEWIVRKKGGLL